MGTESPTKYKITPESIYSIDSTEYTSGQFISYLSSIVLKHIYSLPSDSTTAILGHTIRQYRLLFILFYILASVGGLHGMQLVY